MAQVLPRMVQVLPRMVQVPFYLRNLHHQNSVEGQFAAQVPPLFWNLHRLSRNLRRLPLNLHRLPPLL
jgi:hypothetical protein